MGKEVVKRKVGRPPKIDEAKCARVIAEVREGMPLNYACDMAGLPRRTAYNWIQSNPEFGAQLAAAKSSAVKGLIAATNKQGGAWKLLKNIAKDEFKEHVEVEQHTTHELILNTADGRTYKSPF